MKKLTWILTAMTGVVVVMAAHANHTATQKEEQERIEAEQYLESQTQEGQQRLQDNVEHLERDKKEIMSYRHKHANHGETDYFDRYEVFIDLSRVLPSANTKKLSKSTIFSEDERAAIHSELANQLPAGTDFSLGQIQPTDNGSARVLVRLPADSLDVAFVTNDLVLEVNNVQEMPIDTQYVRGLSDYFLPDAWTKSSGLSAIEAAFSSGESFVEATLILDKAQASAVLLELRGGDTGLDGISLSQNHLAYALYLEPLHVGTLQNSTAVVNVIPNLPTPQN